MLLVVLPLRVPCDYDLRTSLIDWMDSLPPIEDFDQDFDDGNNGSDGDTYDRDNDHRKQPANGNESRNSQYGQDTNGNETNNTQYGQNSSNGSNNRSSNSNTASRKRRRRPDFMSSECEVDITRLADLRASLKESLSQGYDAALEALPDLKIYAAMLAEFCDRGFPIADEEGRGLLDLPWRTTEPIQGKAFIDPHMQETHSSLMWERANVVWNMAVLQAYEASLAREKAEQEKSSQAWNKPGGLMQVAASYVRDLRYQILEQTDDFQSIALSKQFLGVWEAFLNAEVQWYGCAGFMSKPKGRTTCLMVAKLATGAVTLFRRVQESCEQQKNIMNVALLDDWEDAAKAWGHYAESVAQYNQAFVEFHKKEYALQVTRLQKSIEVAVVCRDICDRVLQDAIILHGLPDKVSVLLRDLNSELQTAEGRLSSETALPKIEHTSPIPPQIMPIKQTSLPALEEPIFTQVMDPTMRRYVELFHTKMEMLVGDTAARCEDKTDAARRTLAAVNLPHSLTAYRQELNGGGLPDDLWQRVERVRLERRDERLKEELWSLRETAETAKHTYAMIEDLLDEDLRTDREFREQYNNSDNISLTFEGHDVVYIQKTFRQALQNYARLMASASESDSLLQQRCEILETDPKFRLLQFGKRQLDRLLPGRRSEGHEDGAIDTSALSDLLVQLNAIFDDRDHLIHELREEAKNYPIVDTLQGLQSEENDEPPSIEDYDQTVNECVNAFAPILDRIDELIDGQAYVLQDIIRENEAFMHARQEDAEGTNGGGVAGDNNNDSIIGKIEDALEEIDLFSKHLNEGRVFYDVMIPKLEKLHMQAGDLSARLTVERCEFEDRTRRARQEEEDMRFAEQMRQEESSRSNGGGAPGSAGRAGSQEEGSSPPSLPTIDGVESDKLGNLVGMGFEVEAAAKALKNHNNDVQQAVNELLMG